MKRWLAGVLLPASLWLGGQATPASASVLTALDLKALTSEAERVVVARVVSQTSLQDRFGRIVTDVELAVERSEKGDLKAGQTMVLRRLGGHVGKLGMRVEGEPAFEANERVLLFARGRLADVARAVGMSQGVLRIEERGGVSWVSSSVGGAALVERAKDGSLTKAKPAMAEPRKLSEVLDEIRALVAESSAP